MSTPENVTIPKGSLVLVTGASGYVASHVVLQFLERGYKVRGTIRNPTKAAFLSSRPFEKYVKDGSFELVTVLDMSVPGAYDEAVKGAAAVIHVASVVSFEPDPHKIVTPAVEGTLSVLRAVANEPSVKRLVITSSIGAVIAAGQGGPPGLLTRDSWNDAAVEKAWAPPPYTPDRGVYGYSASKVQAEKAAWKFMEEEKPGFVLNTITPFTIWGAPFDPSHMMTSNGWIVGAYLGKTEQLEPMSGLAYLHVKDCALLHLAAALDPEVNNERIHSWAEKFNWDTVLDKMRKMYPDHQFMENLPNQAMLPSDIDDTLHRSLLKKWGGQDGWIPMEQAIREVCDAIRAAPPAVPVPA